MKINPASYEARIAIQKEIFAHLEAVVAIGNHYRKVNESGFWTDLPADTKTITYYYKLLQQAGYDIPAALKWELLQVEITRLSHVLKATASEHTRYIYEQDFDSFLEAAETLIKKRTVSLEKSNYFYGIACDEAQKSAFKIVMTEIIKDEDDLLERLNGSVEQMFFR